MRSATAFRMPAAAAAAPVAPITVVLVISNLEYGGAQRQVVELANNFDPSRVRVHVCSLSSYRPLARELRIPADCQHVIEKRGKYDLSVVPRLAALLKRTRADVVHGYLFDAEVAVRLAGRFAGTRVVAGSERNTNYTLKRVQLGAYRLTRDWVGLIVANSHAGAAFHRKTLGHDPRIYRVIHNGVDTTRFTPGDRGDARVRLGLDPARPTIGMFASFKRQKNHPLLFEAAHRLLPAIPDLQLLLVGDQLHGGMHGSSDYKRETEALIDRLGLRPHCLALGNRDDVDLIYPACDVTVLPSLFEGTPNAALESMACGVPVIVTNVADNAIIAPDGRVGFVVPLDRPDVLADRLQRLLKDPEMAAACGAEARRWAIDEFSTRRLAEKTESVYRERL
jgi:glycosyltransferase involved in cell wall biosynthesis